MGYVGDNEAILEGQSANNWTPGAWANTPNYSEDEWQPDIEPPHIPDYAAFKKHKHYGQYFRPYRYRAFPAWVYHPEFEPKLIDMRNRDGSLDEDGCKRQVMLLGPGWSPTPNKPRIDMTGKSLPVKSETQRLAEVVAQALAVKATGSSGGIDATAIAAVVAAVMAAMPQNQPAATAAPTSSPQDDMIDPASDLLASTSSASDDIERAAMIEFAEKNNIKIDKRWSNDRIKKELGL